MPDFTMVPVPPDRVLEVYALLSRVSSETVEPEPPVGAAESSLATGRATDASVIARAYRESSPKMKAFLDYLADRPEQKISTEEVGNAIGYSWNQVAGMLGAFGRRWEHRYKAAGDWFFPGGWNYGENHLDYRMPGAAAAIIKETRSGS
jgi:hypothetical protein